MTTVEIVSETAECFCRVTEKDIANTTGIRKAAIVTMIKLVMSIVNDCLAPKKMVGPRLSLTNAVSC